jgi:quinol monooxygenase YgiN
MVWVDLKPGDGGCQPILDFLTEILPDTRSFDGCQDRMVFIEYWDSAEHYQRYLNWRTETGVLDRLVEMLAAPPVIRIAQDSGV